jgi:hypothetical protein
MGTDGYSIMHSKRGFVMRATKIWLWSWAVVMVVAFSATASQAVNWYVGNNGDDSAGCTKASPCRSITKAISAAATGDTIIVGPGVYGDLDGSGTIGDFPGEETPAGGCMITIDRQLTIKSRDGAHVTVLDAANLAPNVVCIAATASGTVFGKLNNGFTIRGGTSSGVTTDPAVQKVKVQGNIALGNSGNGFDISGSGGGKKAVVAVNNIAAWNSVGFALSGTGNSIKANRAVRNFLGFSVQGTGHKVTQNVATENLAGGFEIVLLAGMASPLSTFTKNAAVANGTFGIEVLADEFLDAEATVVIKNNDMFGNADEGNNCGLAIQNGSASELVTVKAKNNFWGAATGIGINPADSAGGACTTNSGGGVTLDTSNPAKAEFVIVEKALK